MVMDVMLRTRAVRGTTEPRGTEEGEVRRKSGCGLPRPATHAHNDPRHEESCDKTAKRGRYRQMILGQTTEWNAMHTHAHAQTIGGCKIPPLVAIPLAPTGTAEFLNGSLWRESQLCRLPKQQRGTPHGQDNENDGKAIRQLIVELSINTTHYDTFTTTPTQATPANTTTTTQQDDPDHGNLRKIKRGGQKKGNTCKQGEGEKT